MRHRAVCAVLVAGLLAAAGCKTAVNYKDPQGPWYEHHATASPPATHGPALRVVTFNIEYALRVDLALEVLRQEAALQHFDVLVLQEMDAPGVEKIAQALDLNSVYAPSGIHPTPQHDFGCAILSPWPLTEVRKIVLPHGARGTGLVRAAVGATVTVDGRPLRVYGVHLPSPLGVSGGSRKEQVATLLAEAAASPDPVVIAGDLNAHGIGEQFVKAGYAWLTRDVGATASKFGFGLAYDHVFARGLRPAAPPAAGVIEDNRKSSDHRPVWALLEWPE